MNENAKSLEKIKAPAPESVCARQSANPLWHPGKGFTRPPGLEPRGALSERVADIWRRLEPVTTPAGSQPTPAPSENKAPDAAENEATPDLANPLYVLHDDARPAGRGGWWLAAIAALLGIGLLLRMTGSPREEPSLPQAAREETPVLPSPPAAPLEQPPAVLAEPVATPPVTAPEPAGTLPAPPDESPEKVELATVPEPVAPREVAIPVQAKPVAAAPPPSKPKATPAPAKPKSVRAAWKPKARASVVGKSPPATSAAPPAAAVGEKAPPAQPPAAEPGIDFVVAYGCFSNAEEVARRASRIQARGWPVLTSHYTLAQTVMTCLYGGPFGNPREADRATELFDEKGCMQLPKTPLPAP
ncbi:MAG: hypothetical protein HQL96_12810 [Magnetococcales bacterium]|nr:hypothetical protein [Magnetococcales bacterium]